MLLLLATLLTTVLFALLLMIVWQLATLYTTWCMQKKLRVLVESHLHIKSALARYKRNSNIYNELHLARSVTVAFDDPALSDAVDYYWNGQ